MIFPWEDFASGRHFSVKTAAAKTALVRIDTLGIILGSGRGVDGGHLATRRFPEKDPVGRKAELSGHLDNPAVRDAALAARLTHGLRGDPEQFGELAVAPESGTLKQTIESFWRSIIHVFGLDYTP